MGRNLGPAKVLGLMKHTDIDDYIDLLCYTDKFPPFLPPPGDSFIRTFPTKLTKVLGLLYTTGWVYYNPNTIKSYKILQKLVSPKHAAHGVAQSPYPIYRHEKACLSKQPPWRAAPDPRIARGRSRV